MDSIFQCTSCKRERVYGSGISRGSNRSPVIFCDGCGRATVHTWMQDRQKRATITICESIDIREAIRRKIAARKDHARYIF